MKNELLISVHELCSQHGIEPAFILSLKEFGLVEITEAEEDVFVSNAQLAELERMIRLHYELDINIEGIDVIRHLLRKLENAQDEICKLNALLKFYKDIE